MRCLTYGASLSSQPARSSPRCHTLEVVIQLATGSSDSGSTSLGRAAPDLWQGCEAATAATARVKYWNAQVLCEGVANSFMSLLMFISQFHHLGVQIAFGH